MHRYPWSRIGMQQSDHFATACLARLSISAVIYFLILMAVVYFVIAVPYKMISARRGVVVFGEPAPAKTCPACLSDDLPVAASKCKYCGTDQPQPEAVSSETP